MAQGSQSPSKGATSTDRLIYQRQSQICKAFANPVRLQILEILGQQARHVAELLEVLGISKANLSQHLSILRNSGIITTSRVGKEMVCTLATPEVKDASQLIRNLLNKQIEEDLRFNSLFAVANAGSFQREPQAFAGRKQLRTAHRVSR